MVSIEERLVNNSLLIQERLGNIVNELEGIKNASLQSGRAMVDTESNNEQFAIVSLGGAFGGAIAGGFVSSYLQARFSNASRRNSDHLQELKERIVISLLDSTLDRNFWSLETLFTGFRITTNAIPKSDDVLFQDFMENHYSNIKTELGSVMRLESIYSANERQIVETLKSRIEEALQQIHREGEVNEASITSSAETIARRVLLDYNPNYIRIGNYLNTRHLYFYPTPDPMIFFRNEKEYGIFKAAHINEQHNIQRVNDVRAYVIQSLGTIIADLQRGIDNYGRDRDSFLEQNGKLVDSLLRAKYSTKLKFEKKRIITRKGIVTTRCRLT